MNQPTSAQSKNTVFLIPSWLATGPIMQDLLSFSSLKKSIVISASSSKK